MIDQDEAARLAGEGGERSRKRVRVRVRVRTHVFVSRAQFTYVSKGVWFGIRAFIREQAPFELFFKVRTLYGVC